MKCSHCKHDNTPGSVFCSQCGTKQPAGCSQCGAEVKPEDRFCSRCGASLATSPPLPAAPEPLTLEEQFASFQEGLPTSFREQLLAQPEGENRVVTVLFADMSSSVAATGDLHPEDAVALVNRLLRAMVDVLIKYEGRVDRFLGDGLLAVFGTPVAHESDPERAILAAMEIREAALGLGLSVTAGINTGEVYVGGIGSERHQEVTVMGPVVNLASRLQGQAQPGQILVGAATYRQTRRAFEFSPLSLEIKGIVQPVTAYVAERPLPRPEKTRGIEGLRAELIGRDDEFAKLQDALAGLLQGQGQMVTLIGEAGVGKSRLAAELKQAAGPGPTPARAPARNLIDEHEQEHDSTPGTPNPTPLWLEGRCLELGMTASYWPFLDLLREYFAWSPEEDEAARAGRLVAAVRELVGRGDLSETRFDEIGPLLGHLFSIRFGNDWDERLKNAGPEEIKHRTFLAIRDLFLALSRRQPLILILEDLHWADSLSLDLISLLMETVTIAPIFLLCAYRPEREHRCRHLATIAARKCAERYTEISLRELSAGQSRRLIESLLRIDNLPPAIKETILQKSGGNPFFVEEVVRSLIASGMVYQEGDAWKAREGIEKVTVPESIQSVILSRVDRLEQELKRVLQSAAVIGRLFRRRLLEYTAREATALERDLWELEEQALIYQERAVPEEEYSFKHVLTQETIYQNILRPRRAVFHQQVAEAMETLYQDGLEEYVEQLAYHYERTGIREKAVEYLLKAGDKARRSCLNEEALAFFQHALERLDSSHNQRPPESRVPKSKLEVRLEALRGLGQVYWVMGNNSAAEVHLREAIEAGKALQLAPRALVRLYAWLAETMFWLRRHDERRRIGEEGLALLGDDTECAEAAWMISHIAAGAWHGGGDEKIWRECNNRNARMIENLPYTEEMRPAYVHLVHMYVGDKNPEEALKWIRALARRAVQEQDLRTGEEVYLYEQGLLSAQGDAQGAIALGQHLEQCCKIGAGHLVGWWLACMSDHSFWIGDLEGAMRCAEEGLTAEEERGSRQYFGGWQMRIGLVHFCRGSWAGAADAFREALKRSRDIKDKWGEAWALINLGRVCLAHGQRHEALEQFQTAITLTGQVSPEGLAALEEAYDDPEAFRAFCLQFRQNHPGSGETLLAQWYPEPAQPDSGFSIREFGLPASERAIEHANAKRVPAVQNRKSKIQNGRWAWHDPFGDCSFAVEEALVIHAANARDLWHLNLSAPRLLRPVAGDLAIQTVCVRATTGRPAIGGLLLWKDKENYLRLDRGTRGKHEISFQGCLGNKDALFGRGHLPGEQIRLRLERLGGRVNALCSADGREWFTVGQVEFPAEDPVQVGLHAIGNIDRLVYPGAFPEGTAIRFESFELWANR